MAKGKGGNFGRLCFCCLLILYICACVRIGLLPRHDFCDVVQATDNAVKAHKKYYMIEENSNEQSTVIITAMEAYSENYLLPLLNIVVGNGHSLEFKEDELTGELVSYFVDYDPDEARKELKRRLEDLKRTYDWYSWVLDEEVLTISKRLNIPDLFPNMEFTRGVFARAVKAGYMEQREDGSFEWKGTGRGSKWNPLGYMISRLFDVSYRGDGREGAKRNIPTSALAELFGISKSSLSNYIKRGSDSTRQYGGNNEKWKAKMAKLFES